MIVLHSATISNFNDCFITTSSLQFCRLKEYKSKKENNFANYLQTFILNELIKGQLFVLVFAKLNSLVVTF